MEDLNNGPTPEILFVVAHFIGGFIFIQYIYQNRKQNPIKQNSPWLTIFAQVLLFISTLCLLVSKILLSKKQKQFDYSQKGCLLNNEQLSLYNWMIGVNLAYIFSLEFVYITYFLKMIRVLLTVFQKQWFFHVFKREWTLLFISGVWGLLITGLDAFFKKYQQDRLLLYPQIVTFMCDDQQYTSNGVEYFWYTRQFLLLVPYLWSFWHSYRLQQIDEDLKLRKQYFVLLSLPLISMVVTKSVKVSGSSMNISLLIHYVDCITNLCACLLLFIIHFRTPQNRDLYLPDDKDLDGQQLDFSYLMSNKQSSDILAKYFEHKRKQKLFQAKKKLSDKSFDHKNITEEILEQILNSVEVENIQEQVNKNIDLDVKFNKAKNIIDRQIKQVIKQWKSTVSYQTLSNKWQKNRRCYQKMMKLNLVKLIINPTSSISEPRNQSNIKQQQKEQTQVALLEK